MGHLRLEYGIVRLLGSSPSVFSLPGCLRLRYTKVFGRVAECCLFCSERLLSLLALSCGDGKGPERSAMMSAASGTGLLLENSSRVPHPSGTWRMVGRPGIHDDIKEF